MLLVGLADKKDGRWLRQLIRDKGLPVRPAEEGEGWDLFVDGQGRVHGGGQVITCGMDPRCTLTASSLLQEGGMASLQQEICTLSGRAVCPQELPLTGLSGFRGHRLTACALLLLLDRKP